jgi:DNA-binding transcriptional LysR family regulator
VDDRPAAAAPPESDVPPLRVSFVTGVTPDKWARRWRDRQGGIPLELLPVDQPAQLTPLRDGSVDMAFVRLPVDREGLHVIPLWTEVPVVVVSREHPVAAYDEVPLSDLVDEHLLQNPDEVPAWRDIATEVRDGTRHPVPPMTPAQVVESVAAQGGVAILPAAVARVHHRKDVVPVPVTGLDETRIGLAWSRVSEDPRVETFIGIVRGRTERSSRGAGVADPPSAPAGRQRQAPRATGKRAASSAGKGRPSRGATSRRRGRR